MSEQPIPAHNGGNTTRLYEKFLSGYGGAGEASGLVLDDHGSILYCNPAADLLLGAPGPVIAGRSFAAMAPRLRLHPNAPGSNVTYAAFCGGRNEWRTLDIQAGGTRVELDVQLDLRVAGTRYLILVWVRPSSRGVRHGHTDGAGVLPMRTSSTSTRAAAL